MLEEMEMGLREVDRALGEPPGLFAGLLSRLLYHFFAEERLRRMGKRRIAYFLRCLEGPGDSGGGALFEGFLRNNETWGFLRSGHPKREEMRSLMREEFEDRLDLLRPVSRKRGASYRELVRAAYPRRSDLRKRMEAQVGVVRRQVALLEKHPDLLRVPGLLRGEVVRVMRRMMDYGEGRVAERMERFYGEER